MAFEHAFEEVILIEGGYANNKKDSGGETMWGITKALARKHGYTGDMHALKQDQAKAIYEAEFWTPLMLDAVESYSTKLAREMFEVAVNSGPSTAAKFLQRLLRVLNRNGRDYADIVVDGDLGMATLTALKGFKAARGDEGMLVLCKAMNCLQGSFLVGLAEQREKDEEFIFGWLKNRISL